MVRWIQFPDNARLCMVYLLGKNTLHHHTHPYSHSFTALTKSHLHKHTYSTTTTAGSPELYVADPVPPSSATGILGFWFRIN
ncbi:hypothetical protein QVD17_40804 [Tagetes erecta]|uniref:Uncharacterized protein n=1 Tax=Tagetes erecta TaxID=13708 RepID=A0AAD8NH32_TARER|nr:hypothetical protein QVD17_40804 [Tagetes erecta]